MYGIFLNIIYNEYVKYILVCDHYCEYIEKVYILKKEYLCVKRKVIKQGHNTLTITIPSDWAQRFNLKAGDEIDLAERDNGLFISTEASDDSKQTVIDMKGLDLPTLWKYFMAVYREGYSEVKVEFDPDELYDNPYKFYSAHTLDSKYGKRSKQHSPIEAINVMLNRFIGFAVIDTHKDYCIIKNMGEVSSKEFNSSLRRVFLLIQQMGEEINSCLKNGRTNHLNHAHDIDINIDKFHDYCIRVLNKTGFQDVKKSHLMFSTIYILELIGDEFKRAAHHILVDMKGKSFENIAPLAKMVIDQVESFYDFFYNFERKKIRDNSSNRRKSKTAPSR